MHDIKQRCKGKVLIFALGQLDNMGGVQRSYQLLTDYLVYSGWDVDLFGFGKTLDKKADPLQLACPLSRKVNVRVIPTFLSYSLYLSLVEEVRDINPDVILVVNSSSRAVFFSAIAKHLEIPLVFSMRGSTEYCLRYIWPCRNVFDLPFKVADAVHLLMPSYKNILHFEDREKVSVIPSQIEPASSYASPEKANENNRYKVLYSGRLSFEKQIHHLIDAFALLAHDFPYWDLQIIGNGPLEEKLKDQAKRTDLGERIEWLSVDNTESMYQLYPKAHLKVLSSEYEGCPMSLREAMAHGLPVIAYDTCTGSNEIIEHGIDGLLASSDKPVEGLLNAMRELMSDPIRRFEMGKRGIQKATQYLPEPINQKWEQLLLSAINQKKNETPASPEEKDLKLLEKLAVEGTFGSAMIFDKDEALYQKYRKEFLTIYGHRLFNDRYYLETYLDVKVSGQDPLLHYISEGWKLGYNPSPEFDTNRYQALYMDDKSLCPLVHFYTQGAFEGCFPPQADQSYYEKWPGRKPKVLYSIIDDLSNVKG